MEFKACIQVSTVTMIGCSSRSRKQSQFISFRGILQFIVLTRMCIWYIINTDGCLLMCARDQINKQM